MWQGGASNNYSLSPPIGGNYYDDYDESGEGCIDTTPADGFCDAPLVFDNNQDDYPWAGNVRIGDGSNPPDGSVCPGDVAVELDSFTIRAIASSFEISSVQINLQDGTEAARSLTWPEPS